MNEPLRLSPVSRLRVRVTVVPQPDQPPGATAIATQAKEAMVAVVGQEPRIVRRYRETPSPLLRDAVRGWRTGRWDRVPNGDFDLIL